MLRLVCSLVLLTTLSISVNGLTASVAKEAREVIPGVGEYYFNGVPANWTEAYHQCRLSGGHLAILSSREEANALSTIMAKFGATSIHLGFHDRIVEGVYDTILGESVDDRCSGKNGLWAAGSPKGSTTYNCGGYTAAGMTDTDCDLKSVFICELTEEQTEAPVEDGYELIDGFGYYKYHSENSSWPQAWASCKQEGAHLVVFNSAEEVAALQNKYSYKYCWVGVHRLLGGDNDFITVFGDRLEDTGFSEWYLSEPLGTFLSNPYVVMYYTGQFYTRSESEQVRMGFVCERV